MKILHITTSIEAGAGRGAHLLHKALLARGVDSRILTFFPDRGGDATNTAVCTNWRRRLMRLLMTQLDMVGRRMHPTRGRELFSWGLFGFGLDRLPGVREADLLNLHWINHGMVRISSMRRVRKPVVWTMRDMWPFTGGCHYSFDCNRYKTECQQCPQLNSQRHVDAAYLGFRAKRRWYPETNFHAVAISNWLADCARQSVAFAGREVTVIPNGIDLGVYYPEERRAARRMLGLPDGARVAVFGATDIGSRYKGFSYLRDALKLLSDRAPHLLVFGDGDSRGVTSPGGCTKLGVVTDEKLLRTVYSAGDVFVAPSIAEAFGKTIVEAMACGSPVVCFDLCGPRDIVKHRETGWRARPLDTRDLADGIEWVLDHPSPGLLGAASRQRVVHEFDIHGSVADRYLELYKRCARLAKAQ